MQRLYVPATVANLGSGFDSLGAALNLHLQVEYRPAASDSFLYEGEGRVENDGGNLIHAAVRAAFSRLGQEPPPLQIHALNPIPLARGLGSSAAARVAGAMIADRLLDGKLGREGVFRVASELEGHPDNVAPAVFGGVQLALQEPLLHVSLPAPEDLYFVVAVPEFELPTDRARAALPREVPFADAVFNLSRAALWPAALAAGDLGLLLEASRDRLHQPYRLELMPGAEEALSAAHERGYPAFVAGAGPTLAALTADPVTLRGIFDAYVSTGGRLLTLTLGKGAQWKAT